MTRYQKIKAVIISLAMLWLVTILGIVFLRTSEREAVAYPPWGGTGQSGTGGASASSATNFQNQTAWFLDPANSSTCASDSNATCSLSTCGTPGDGPCLHFYEIASRWGGWPIGTGNAQLAKLDPTITQPTTITQMSSMGAAQLTSDPITLTPRLASIDGGAGNTLTFICSLPTPFATGTINSATAKNRTSTPGVQLNLTISGFTAAAGDLIHNTTHNSWAWVQANAGGVKMTQPLLTSLPNVSGALGIPAAAEVDTWTNTDALTDYRGLIQTKITKVRPYTQFQGPNEGGVLIVKNCDLQFSGLENSGDNTIDVGRNVMLVDGQSDYMVGVDDVYVNDNGVTAGSFNWNYTGAFSGGFRGSNVLTVSGSGPGFGLWQIIGGMTFATGAQIPNFNFNGVHLDGDVVLFSGSFAWTGYNSAGYWESLVPPTQRMIVTQGVLDMKSFNEYGGNIMWSRLSSAGSPLLNAGYGSVVFPFGSSGGTGAFPGNDGITGQNVTVNGVLCGAGAATLTSVAMTTANLNTFPDGGTLCATPGLGCFSNLGP